MNTLEQAKQAVKDNPGVSPADLLVHPNKKWDVEAAAYLQSLSKPEQTNDRAATPAEEAEAIKIASSEPVKSVSPEPVASEPPANPILQAALRCVELGWFVFALEEHGKRPDGELSPHGFNSSTNDPDVVRSWFVNKNPNYGIDLGRSNLTVLDFDKGMPVGLELPNTLQVSTSRGVHVYFQGVSKQGDLHLSSQHVGEIKSGGGYVLGPGCVHPDGPIYTVVRRAPVASVPSLESFRATDGKTKTTTRNERGLIPHGSIHTWMLTKAGQGRQLGMELDELEPWLLRQVHENCEPPIDDSKVEAMAKSVCGLYEPGEDHSLVLNAGARSSASGQQSAALANEDDVPDVFVENDITYAIIPHGNGFRRVALDTSEASARPKFPNWVMTGTSIYENLVKPAVETSSKYAEFIFIPAMQMMMNYLSRKVQIELHPTSMNLFVGLVSPYGKFFKSSSCQLAHDYFRAMELCAEPDKATRNSDGKIMITQAGSPEGMGIEMQRINGKHAIMFNDELGKLVSKAGIDGSGFSSDLLSWYESGYFGNKVKNPKSSFTFPPGSYTFGWLWCTTDRNFNHFWPKLAGISSGIQDRLFFVVAPEQPRPVTPFRNPSLDGAKKTRELIDRAVKQRTFRLDDPLFQEHIAGIDDPRSLDLVMKLSLYFAIDLGLDVIDEDCVERARALVDYRNQATRFLEPIEADNAEGRLMQEIRREIRQHGGIMVHRDLCRNMNADRAGRLWDIAYNLLKNAGTQAIVEFYEGRTKGKRKTRMVAVKIDDEDLPE